MLNTVINYTQVNNNKKIDVKYSWFLMQEILIIPDGNKKLVLPTLCRIGANYVYVCTQSCPILCDSMDGSPPGFSVHGILQARILEWVAIPFSRGFSRPKDRTCVSCIAGRFYTTGTTSELAMESNKELTRRVWFCRFQE